MNEKITRNILSFLERTTLTGKEAPAWCEAYAALQTSLEPAIAPPPSEPTP